MTKEEIKNYVIEHKECCKKLAEEYRQRYNEDNTDKLALNMFYHNVISYNDFETILATIEDRNSMIMCFSAPPVLTEETVEINLKRIEYLEKEKQYFSDSLDKQIEATLKLDKENAELDCQKNRNKFCYSCVNATEKCFKNEIGCPCDKYKSWKDENAELKAGRDINVFTKQLTKAKEIIKTFLGFAEAFGYSPSMDKFITEAEQFLNSEVEK